MPRIVDTLERLPATSVTLDGEGVACGPDGVTDFEPLSAALDRPSKRKVFLYAFDLLELDGHDLHRESLIGPAMKLARLLRGAGHGVELSDHMEGNDGEVTFRHAKPWGPKASFAALWVKADIGQQLQSRRTSSSPSSEVAASRAP